MPYLGKQPANVPVTADDIPDNSITSAKILDGVITIADIANDAVTEDKLANSINTAIAANTAKTTNSTNASDLSSGTLPMARLSGTLPALDGSGLTGVATDLTALRNDIATLALHSGVADNKAAYNLPNSFIDQFEDDSGIGTETNVDRTSSEHVDTVTVTGTTDSNTKLLIHSNTTNNSTTFIDSATLNYIANFSTGWSASQALSISGSNIIVANGTGTNGWANGPGVQVVSGKTYDFCVTGSGSGQGVGVYIAGGQHGLGYQYNACGTYTAASTGNVAVALFRFSGHNGTGTITGLTIKERTLSVNNQTKHSTTYKKFGTTSILFDGAEDSISMPISNDFNFGSGNFTVETWVYPTSYPNTYNAVFNNFRDDESTSGWSMLIHSNGTIHCNVDGTYNNSTNSVSLNQWSHLAMVRDGNSIKRYINGVDAGNTLAFSGSVGNVTNQGLYIGESGTEYSNRGFNGYMDEIRISKGVARYTTAFTPQTMAHPVTTPSATGTLISTAQTANTAQTKVSGVILYQNIAGTATLGTDLEIYFTCNGGTNWTESTPVAAGTFSSGVLMAKCPEVTCTSGTDVRYKVVWANQASGSKVTGLFGIAINY